jgi:hypothetical protein
LIRPADHKAPIGYALTRVINPAPTAPVTKNGAVGDPALRNWLDFQKLNGSSVTQGDILRVAVLPGGCLFWGFFWEVETPLPGFSFSVAFSRIGNPAYVPGSTSIPDGTIGTVLLNAQSGAVPGFGFVGCDGTVYTGDTTVVSQFMRIGATGIYDGIPGTATGTPPSDCLAIRLDSLPNNGGGAADFGNLRMKISPVLFDGISGQW